MTWTMTRSWVVVGGAVLLAAGLSIESLGGVAVDTDGDGIVDTSDNCLVVPNGPLLATGSCDTQLDGDLDGYGNPCDTDVSNDGATGLNDVLETLNAASLLSTDPRYDFDCDGGASLNDVLKVLHYASILMVPGPSGLACAGTVPCP